MAGGVFVNKRERVVDNSSSYSEWEIEEKKRNI